MPVNPSFAPNTQTETPRRLSDDSPADAPWDYHGSAAQDIMILMSEGDDWQLKKSESMEWCGRYLTFAFAGDIMKLRKARFCRVRLCPRCQWRKSLAWKARWYKAWPEIQKAAPKARYFHLVLTVPNVPVEELRATILKMSKAWDRMRARKTWPGIGFVRATEVTIEEKRKGYVHPHFHVLMMVTPSYFTHGYMSAESWRGYWAKALGMNAAELTKPYIRSIDPKQGLQGTAHAVKEVFKYAVKFETKKEKRVDCFWRETFLEMDRQLKGTQATSLGGILREVFRGEEEVTEEEMLCAEESAEDAEEYRQYIYRFDLMFYAFHKKLDAAEVERIKEEDGIREKKAKARSGPLPKPLRSSEAERLDWSLNRACLQSMKMDALQQETKRTRKKRAARRKDAGGDGDGRLELKLELELERQ
jgi:plasmid rolling circle replication initiator protein Rep